MKTKLASSISCAKSRDILIRLTTPSQIECMGGRVLQILVFFVQWDGRVFVLPDA